MKDTRYDGTRTREIGIDDKLCVSASKNCGKFSATLQHTDAATNCRHHNNHRTDPTMSDEESYEYEYE